VVFFVYFRLRAQTAQLQQMADTVAQVTRGKR
jgi:hypothetical protein